MGMLLLDIAKAFNCVSHELLFIKMYGAGFSPVVIQCFRSYLDCTQCVRIQDKVSDTITNPKTK